MAREVLCPRNSALPGSVALPRLPAFYLGSLFMIGLNSKTRKTHWLPAIPAFMSLKAQPVRNSWANSFNLIFWSYIYLLSGVG